MQYTYILSLSRSMSNLRAQTRDKKSKHLLLTSLHDTLLYILWMWAPFAYLLAGNVEAFWSCMVSAMKLNIHWMSVTKWVWLKQ